MTTQMLITIADVPMWRQRMQDWFVLPTGTIISAMVCRDGQIFEANISMHDAAHRSLQFELSNFVFDTKFTVPYEIPAWSGRGSCPQSFYL